MTITIFQGEINDFRFTYVNKHVYKRSLVSPCVYMKIYAINLCGGHTCQGVNTWAHAIIPMWRQSRACKSLLSPSTVWELRIGFRLSHLHTLRPPSSPTLLDFYLKGHAVMVESICLPNTTANVIHNKHRAFEAFLLPSSPPVIWEVQAAKPLSLTLLSEPKLQTKTFSILSSFCLLQESPT